MTQEHQDITMNERNFLDNPTGRVIAAGVIATEVSPLNEVIRGALTIGAGVISKDPLVVAGVFGAATAVIEGGAALVTAEALDTKQGKNLIKNINGKLGHLGISKDARTNTATDFGVGMLGGSAVSMLVKQSQDPERTKEQNRAYGVKLSLGVAGACTGLSYAAAEGILNPGVETIGAAAIATGGLGALIGWAKRRVSK